MFRPIAVCLLVLSLALVVAPAEAKDEETTPEETEEMQYKPKRNFSDALKVGDEGPLFSLKALHGDDVFDLADYHGEKPVVLFFGSYT